MYIHTVLYCTVQYLVQDKHKVSHVTWICSVNRFVISAPSFSVVHSEKKERQGRETQE